MKKIGMLFGLLAGALLATHVQAQVPGQVYFGVAGGGVRTDSEFPSALNSTEDTGTGGKIYFGSMGERFGWEIGGYHFGKYDVTLAGTSTKVAESKTVAVAVSGVYATELGGDYTFHAKVGLAVSQHEMQCPASCTFTKSTKRGVAGLVGFGVGLRLLQNMQAHLDFEHIGSVQHAAGLVEYKDGYDMLSVGLQFNF